MRRQLRWGLVAILCLTAIGTAVGAGVAQARTIATDEHVSLHLVRKSGSTLYERGSASGTLPGPVAGTFKTTVVIVTGTVTISPRGGSVTVGVVGFPRSAGVVASFTGTVTVKGGTGRYAHARGHGTFTATVNRRTWAVRVHTKVTLRY
jgi:hypothetical protein